MRTCANGSPQQVERGVAVCGSGVGGTVSADKVPGARPCHGQQALFATHPHWRDLILFSEYFHGDSGRGCGASHQTGWTALVARLLRKFGSSRSLSVAGAMQSAMAGTRGTSVNRGQGGSHEYHASGY
jgi:hypothetical protein